MKKVLVALVVLVALAAVTTGCGFGKEVGKTMEGLAHPDVKLNYGTVSYPYQEGGEKN